MSSLRESAASKFRPRMSVFAARETHKEAQTLRYSKTLADHASARRNSSMAGNNRGTPSSKKVIFVNGAWGQNASKIMNPKIMTTDATSMT
jgi:hypothetical protein